MGVMSMDLRERVARAFGAGSSRVVAERFAVSASWVRKFWNRARTTAALLPGGRGHPPRAMDAEGAKPQYRNLQTRASQPGHSSPATGFIQYDEGRQCDNIIIRSRRYDHVLHRSGDSFGQLGQQRAV
jgi:transposase